MLATLLAARWVISAGDDEDVLPEAHGLWSIADVDGCVTALLVRI